MKYINNALKISIIFLPLITTTVFSSEKNNKPDNADYCGARWLKLNRQWGMDKESVDALESGGYQVKNGPLLQIRAFFQGTNKTYHKPAKEQLKVIMRKRTGRAIFDGVGKDSSGQILCYYHFTPAAFKSSKIDDESKAQIIIAKNELAGPNPQPIEMQHYRGK